MNDGDKLMLFSVDTSSCSYGYYDEATVRSEELTIESALSYLFNSANFNNPEIIKLFNSGEIKERLRLLGYCKTEDLKKVQDNAIDDGKVYIAASKNSVMEISLSDLDDMHLSRIARKQLVLFRGLDLNSLKNIDKDVYEKYLKIKTKINKKEKEDKKKAEERNKKKKEREIAKAKKILEKAGETPF